MRLNHWLGFLNNRTAWPPEGQPVPAWAALGPLGALPFSGGTTPGAAEYPVAWRRRLPLKRFPVRSRGRGGVSPE